MSEIFPILDSGNFLYYAWNWVHTAYVRYNSNDVGKQKKKQLKFITSEMKDIQNRWIDRRIIQRRIQKLWVVVVGHLIKAPFFEVYLP